MPTIPLQIRCHDEPLRDAAAWLIPGHGAAEWLAELVEWRGEQDKLALYVVPRSRGDVAPAGLLVVPPPGAQECFSRRALPYGCLAKRLYLPVEARLEPQVSEAELANILPGNESIYLWHPAMGLVAFEPSDRLGFADLLSLPPPVSSDWDRAQPGVARNTRLVSLEPEDVLTLENLLEQGRGDIGERSGRPGEMPPAPHEKESGAATSLARNVQAGLAKAALWLTSFASRGATERTWINRLEDWAQQQLARAQEISERLRNKELERLMHLLDKNPDEGLKYALPLSADPHRGLAPPSNFLGLRDVRFDLARISGGGPADIWEVSAEYRRKMAERYRELAEREMRLGRHRRAAYIFAQLLGDFASAASTLAAGGHYREAAVIYRDRLQRPLDAAGWFEQGGLWSEALALYDDLGEHEKVGDLQARLERPDWAADAYRRAVEKQRRAGDHLSAARLLEGKLAAPDEALAELSGAWPNAGQAAACLAESFKLLARLGRNDAAAKRVGELRQESLSESQGVLLVEALSAVALSYPSPPLKPLASDAARVLAAERLAAGTSASAKRLVAALNRLVPEDRLLTRDCQRYLREREQPSARPTNKFPVRKGPREVHSFSIPKAIDWRTVVSAGDLFYAAGFKDDRLELVRGDWEGNLQMPDSPAWKVARAYRSSAVLLVPVQLDGQFLQVHVVGGPPLSATRSFAQTDLFPRRIAAKAFYVGLGTVAAAHSASGVSWTLDFEQPAYLSGDLTLSSWSSDELVTSRDVEEIWEIDPDSRVLPIPLLARDENVYLGCGNKLVRFGLDKSHESIELPKTIQALAGSALHTRERLACAFEDGGMVFWDPADGGHTESFGGDLDHPRICFTTSGELIAAAPGACEVFETKDQHLKLVARLALTGAPPLAVLPTGSPKQFALISADGEITVFAV